jgi:BioD-like phosphotransacetylase family protein
VVIVIPKGRKREGIEIEKEAVMKRIGRKRVVESIKVEGMTVNIVEVAERGSTERRMTDRIVIGGKEVKAAVEIEIVTWKIVTNGENGDIFTIMIGEEMSLFEMAGIVLMQIMETDAMIMHHILIGSLEMGHKVETIDFEGDEQTIL